MSVMKSEKEALLSAATGILSIIDANNRLENEKESMSIEIDKLKKENDELKKLISELSQVSKTEASVPSASVKNTRKKTSMQEQHKQAVSSVLYPKNDTKKPELSKSLKKYWDGIPTEDRKLDEKRRKSISVGMKKYWKRRKAAEEKAFAKAK